MERSKEISFSAKDALLRYSIPSDPEGSSEENLRAEINRLRSLLLIKNEELRQAEQVSHEAEQSLLEMGFRVDSNQWDEVE